MSPNSVPDVADGSIASLLPCAEHFRSTPVNGYRQPGVSGPKSANKRLMHAANYILFDHLVSAGGMVSQR